MFRALNNAGRLLALGLFLYAAYSFYRVQQAIPADGGFQQPVAPPIPAPPAGWP